jgi:hypothetical protein
MKKNKTGKHLFLATAMLIISSSALYAQENKNFILMPIQAIEAKRNGDIRKADSIANIYFNDYLFTLKEQELLTKDNLSFMSQFLGSSDNNKALKLFLKQPEKVNAVLGAYEAQNRIIEFIAEKYLPKEDRWRTATPDWDALEKTVTSKFGALGRESIWGQRMVYYWMMKNDWDSYAKYYLLYFKSALKHTKFYVNNFSWAIFIHVNDPKILSFACDTVMKYAMENWYQNEIEAYDTYANLLYKLGRTKEAIEWEARAVKLSNNNKTIVETLDKMKKGVATWLN